MTTSIRNLYDLQDRRIMMEKKLPPYGYALILVVAALLVHTVAGWASTISIVCFMGGIQLLCLGVIGEYIGKIYMETKARPRYIISERTWAPYERKYHG